MMKHFHTSLTRTSRAALLVAVLTLAPFMVHAASGDLTTNAASVKADNTEANTANNVSGVSETETIFLPSITNATFVSADNSETVVANNGAAKGLLDNPPDDDDDGVPDFQDLDDDNDGIPDTVENATALNGGDTDGDGVPDIIDLDSDNDGILDAVEAGHGAADVNHDGRVDGAAGTDGIPDAVQPAGQPNGGTINYTVRDTDGDGHPDFQDLDSDNDAINDIVEGGGTDANGNGLFDGPVNTHGIPNDAPVGGLTAPDTDSDGVPDYRDLDSDNDSVGDVVEGGNGAADTDHNGTISASESPDADGDGIPDNVDGAPATFGDLNLTAPQDTDGDGTPDYKDRDSDGDGTDDIDENGHSGDDANNDGKIDNPADTDGDGIPDVVDNQPGQFGGTPTSQDSDGDGVPDFQDLDSDNDGIPDITENATALNSGDTDGDGVPDILDLDSDNDGILDITESGQTTGADANSDGRLDGAVGTDGIPDSVQASPNAGTVNYTVRDTDGDTHPDFQDLDTDNDGINDVVEAGGTDADNDGIADGTTGPSGIRSSVPAGGVVPLNSDNDAVPNYRDLDSDNDTVADVIEGGNGSKDLDHDGTIAPAESADDDGDGIPNSVDEALAVFGDAGNPALPEGADADSVPDYIDTESDGDGITDLVEAGRNPNVIDTNGDGMVDTPSDPDGDGIPNNNSNDSKPAAFGGATQPTTPPDGDGDGVPDVVDLDDDNDGIPDTVENATALNSGDTDGDGVPDILDLDSDNDGILDITESGQTTGADANSDGRLDGAVGTDGIPDSVQASPNAGTVNYTVRDTDGDTHPDFQDLDTDNDGINDVVEAGGTDADNDGIADGTTGPSGIRSSVPAGGVVPPDTDGDGIQDFRDLDTDNDGINDVIENGGTDPDGNGIVGTGATPPDGDSDGIPNAADNDPTVFGDAGNSPPRNSDNDNVPDYRDLDSDNDSIGDVIEGGNGTFDTNGDGTIGASESSDTDGDGIPNVTDGSPTFGDAGDPAPPDTDTDGTPDYRDTDSDGDGDPDIKEAGHGGLDGDGDGQIDNPTDPDGDGIPNNGGNDTNPTGFGGTTPPDYRTPFEKWQDDTPGGGDDPGSGGHPGSEGTPTSNSDYDRLTDLQEYAFSSDPASGVPVVLGNGGSVVAGDAGLKVTQANGAYDVSYRRPIGGRQDVSYTLQQSTDLNTWTNVAAGPVITNHLDGTETVTWTALGAAETTGFVRMKLTLAKPATTQYTWVDSWQSVTVQGQYQSVAHNLVKKPVYSDTVFAASGSTISSYSLESRDLTTYMDPAKSYYLEMSNGAEAGQRWDVNYAGTTANSIALNLGSVNNTSNTLPGDLVGAQFLLREHVTLADVMPKEVFTGAGSASAADQVQIWNGTVWVTYFLLDLRGSDPQSTFYYWTKTGGIVNWDGLVIPPDMGVMAKHANSNATSTISQTGEVRANQFRFAVAAAISFHANGYPLDDSPGSRTYTIPKGFVGARTASQADQIQNWTGDITPNTTGYTTYWLYDGGSPSSQFWVPTAVFTNNNNSPLLKAGRGHFIKRTSTTGPSLLLIEALPWAPAAALPLPPY